MELLHLGFVETHQIVNNTRLCGFWNFKEILACPIPRILGLNRGGHGKDCQWNMLPIGELLWEKELYSYKEFPPLQAPETYNLTGILDAMKKGGHPSDCLTPIVPMPRCSSTARHSPL